MLHLGVVDLGAESGRVVLARFDGERLTFEEAHRFPNRPVMVEGHLYWNVLDLWQEIINGLRKARALCGNLDSVGVDTWGVDYALLDAQGFLLGMPFHYRDRRTDGIMEQVFKRIPRSAIYAQTGIQFMPINTLYQLAAHKQLQPRLFDVAGRFLMMSDLLHAWLSGERASEYTNATTTQLWSAREKRWASELFELLALPTRIAPPVVAPGTLLGPLLPELEHDLGAGVRVAVPATHDTASAVAAVPATGKDGWAYISSGTWSLVGLELPQPLILEAHEANFTNEGGIFGTTRFLKNVMGLWIVQECKRTWEKEGQNYSYAELYALAETAPAFRAFIDPDDARFLAPGGMPARVQAYLAEHLQPALDSPGAVARCILESLVMRYREVLRMAGQLASVQLHTVYIVGGGAQNTQINQWLADATGFTVMAGPIEATAIGNALMQMVALGELNTHAEVRTLATQCASAVVFRPDGTRRAAWDAAYTRYQALRLQS
ncbi:MAG: rhamnulokinase family protein [Ktedonobacteraceae bacterium]